MTIQRHLVRAGVGAAVAALVLSGCRSSGGSDSAAEGITDEACPQAVNKDNGCIYLGVISDLTRGPFAPLAVPITDAQKAHRGAFTSAEYSSEAPHVSHRTTFARTSAMSATGAPATASPHKGQRRSPASSAPPHLAHAVIVHLPARTTTPGAAPAPAGRAR